jgi:hypothetical protein
VLGRERRALGCWEAQPRAWAAASREDLGSDADSSREEDNDFLNIPFFSFSLQCLFCVSRFVTRKHVFGKLNSSFSICTFTDSIRDALML